MGNLVFHIWSEEIIQNVHFVIIARDARREDGERPEYASAGTCGRGRGARGLKERGNTTRRERGRTARACFINTVAIADMSALSGAHGISFYGADLQAERDGARIVRVVRGARKSGASPAFLFI